METFADFDNAEVFTPSALIDEEGKPMERWAPLGANDSPDDSIDENLSASESAFIRNSSCNIDEQEIFNSSLLLLTSHFAQVQFRLEQVCQADPEQKESLLKDLEQFAWKAIPDLHSLQRNRIKFQESVDDSQNDQQRKNISLMIDQLKLQLNDLEQFAYNSGEIHQPPTQCVLEKQRLVLEELSKHLNLNVSEFPSLTEEEIKERVNAGFTQLIKPIKTKEAVVDHLKTQISDLERFIDFLHDDGSPDSAIGKALEAFRRYEQEQRSRTISNSQHQTDGENKYNDGDCHIGLSRRQQAAPKNVGLITRALTVLQVFSTMQLTSRRGRVRLQAERNSKSVKTQKYGSPVSGVRTHHWGDINARLEMATGAVLERAERLRQVRQAHCRRLQTSPNSPSTVPDVETPQLDGSQTRFECCTAKLQDPECVQAQRELNLAVRRKFCPALQELIEHGSRLTVSIRDRDIHVSKTSPLSSILSLLGCFSRNHRQGLNYHNKLVDVDSYSDGEEDDEEEDGDYDSENEVGTEAENGEKNFYFESKQERQAHTLRKRNSHSSAWAIFLKYYILTNGRAFNDTPARKLSESFSLDIIGGKVVTAKQHLLSSMGTVMQEFNKYKRSEEAQFKALVCIGLNSHRLVSWLKLVLRSPLIVRHMYHPWSYVTSPGFDDALQTLKTLSSVEFDLPFDANIRHLQNINYAF